MLLSGMTIPAFAADANQIKLTETKVEPVQKKRRVVKVLDKVEPMAATFKMGRTLVYYEVSKTPSKVIRPANAPKSMPNLFNK